MIRDFCDTDGSNTFAPSMRTSRLIYLLIWVFFQSVMLPAGAQVQLPDSASPATGNVRTSPAPLPGQRDSLPVAVEDSLVADTTAVVASPPDIRLFSLSPDSLPGYSGQRAYGRFVAACMRKHPQVKAAEPSLRLPSLVHKPADLDWVFYLFMGLLFYLALLRISFPKYFQDLLRVFLNSSMRQKQIREQLSQEPLPSLLLNIFFIASAGLFLYFLLLRKSMALAYPSWMVLLACMALPIAVYLVKFIVLKALGWIFGKSDAVDSYLFMVFMVNKMAGMVLLPFSLLLAYASPAEVSGVVWIAVFALIILALYRLIRGFSALRKGLKINQLQYLLFVAAFEVVPILLLYKGLNTLF